MARRNVRSEFIASEMARITAKQDVQRNMQNAAEDMLKALDGIIDCWERGADGPTLAKCLVAGRAAVAKARGGK